MQERDTERNRKERKRRSNREIEIMGNNIKRHHITMDIRAEREKEKERERERERKREREREREIDNTYL